MSVLFWPEKKSKPTQNKVSKIRAEKLKQNEN